MTQLILLGFLGFVLLIFCIIDLWHLKEMLRTMRDMRHYMQELVTFEKWRIKIKK